MFDTICCSICCSDSAVQNAEEPEHVDQVPAKMNLQRKNPKMAELLDALKAGGGPENGAGNEPNAAFLKILDDNFPELELYCIGKIQTSPGVEEIEGSPTEYYRTVGAMIALLACYAGHKDDNFGIDSVSKGGRGPMSMDKVPGKFINIGNKPEQYKKFCDEFAEGLKSEEDWWAMMVFLAVHDVGKSDAFRNAVNATLPIAERSDDHDRALAAALSDIDLKQKFLPSITKLSPKHQEQIYGGFATNFQLPQLGQGEIAVINLRGLLNLPEKSLNDGTLRNYLYHSIFDIAGASSNANFIYPLALVPVYMGFSASLQDLMEKLQNNSKPDEAAIYFKFLHSGFATAYPEFTETVFKSMCESKIFRNEIGLVLLRVLALTRNTYKNPQKVLDILLQKPCAYPSLIREMSGKPDPPGPQIMLYYAPDMLRMGLGEDLTDESGKNMEEALGAMDDVYSRCRQAIKTVDIDQPIVAKELCYQLNVQPIVTVIKNAGKNWRGGAQLKEVCNSVRIESNTMKTEGIVKLPDDEK